jgi:hypothetical protein
MTAKQGNVQARAAQALAAWSAVAAIGLAVVVGCSGSAGTTDSPTSTRDAASGQAQPVASPPVAVASGTDALIDVGKVRAGTQHDVTFIIENPSDKPLRIRAIRGDCECIHTKDAPTEIPAHGSVEVHGTYEVPDTVTDYVAALIVLTEDPQRKMIALKVKSHRIR